MSAFLKIYIRAFQQASDLDDTVEDKLLIGDRPKPHITAVNKGPIRERVAEKEQGEIDEVSHVVCAISGPSSEMLLLLAYFR